MEVWIGPAIVAALVSAFVSAAGWFVSSWQAQRLDERRRDEKVNDFQVALRAEIASDLLSLQVGNRSEMLGKLQVALAHDAAYRPMLPRLASNLVFGQILREIHVLPGQVIAAVIDYERLRQSVELFVDDIRTAQGIDDKRLLLMVSDYIDMLDRLEILATNAVAALDRSLALSKTDEGPPTQASASEPASAERKASIELKASP